MRPIVFGLVAALMAATLPIVSFAATAAAPKPVDPDSIKKGMAAAPAVITQAGLDCSLANARLLGKSTDPKTKLSSTYYELACKQQEGFIVAVPDKGDTQIYTCLEVRNTPTSGAQCVLPENVDQKQGLAPLVAKNKPGCVITDARAIGQTQDRKTTVFEVACEGGIGYIIDASFPVSAAQPATFNLCWGIPAGSASSCTLSPPTGLATYVVPLVAKMGKPCTVTGSRYVGATNDGSNFFEVACDDKKGYMIEQAANGDVKPAIDCAIADNIGSGCTLTNARSAQTEQAGLYSRLAHAAGYSCDVSQYAPFNVNVPGHEVVELACSNRPDGAVAIFPASSSEAAQIYDCAHSEIAGYRCSFTKPDAAFATLTADLNKVGKSSCVVSGSRFVGTTTDKQSFIEVACADGNPGFLITYGPGPPFVAKEALGCSLAKGIAGGCQLPANQKHG
jgi:hypothetical protein